MPAANYNTMAMQQIEQQAKAYRESCDATQQLIDEIEEEIAAIRDKYRTRVNMATASEQATRDALITLVQANKVLFNKPKSRVLDGIKIGFRATKASVKVKDADVPRVEKAVKANLPWLWATLFETKTVLLAAQLERLDDETLQTIGLRRTPKKDEAFARPASGETLKLIHALMGDEQQ